ncbi:tRNA (guanosine(46)-N7)-methyltransferase TrmB [Heyndrickxia oleronia]|jgi:tRNA (guanine-N7-)-methyltransferase|uniref:tRNA (guanine-N(7)-)-methyltransferase n=1 Tax=Heyndrickxia oleronia TaxID=38875 RepID=A0A8E2I429_9BACI|nr:tRNA (guanosine(46)-N7)-methyltransferase TrmB [Heyndrickxia oleronia]OJH17354.1 tRNA (guanosine(46)-N7)-methyltransferase TrmB [Bacillus obstructivus]MDH5164010.1 tRNA (guanosine(46)-N7)-methyltransferase TrmB [Heyndrickxia oleronia]MEC1374095.1 tRNA (guanosine(46)-N7)-methyltransferase TrmB [Heyndrickxia oleronia]OOP66306.1 tRNA (guanosine(46)-N7)-methyltransferase TrmB [Heyndrickxia oleronia]QQZ06312.1 tRNA (guanosine(46)-N7)-methyltransferase TrmB [Heyndrickxia oleronia]
MRLRHKPWAKEKLMEYPQFVVQTPEKYKGKWGELFNNDHPIHIEVGTGKGQFIVGMAKANPEINYIGIEMQDSVIVSALDKLIDEELTNIKLLNIDGSNLSDLFAKGDIERVYLNFSDPWPKKKHAKRRLTYKSFLKLYEGLLIDGGEIHFKTDNQGLFEYSLQSFSEYGLLLKYISLDLHNSEFEDNIMTEYEEKFSAKGQRIYRCEVKYQNEANN